MNTAGIGGLMKGRRFAVSVGLSAVILLAGLVVLVNQESPDQAVNKRWLSRLFGTENMELYLAVWYNFRQHGIIIMSAKCGAPSGKN